jgi:NADH dehydrogenase (ubiquinone) 1 beta subcomplex subunit 8
MGMFTPYEYTWVSPAKGAFQSAIFIAAVLGLCYVVKAVYPDKKSYPREFEGGLEKELGGAGTVRVSLAVRKTQRCDCLLTQNRTLGKDGGRR